jgi:hypothetical protein
VWGYFGRRIYARPASTAAIGFGERACSTATTTAPRPIETQPGLGHPDAASLIATPTTTPSSGATIFVVVVGTAFLWIR